MMKVVVNLARATKTDMDFFMRLPLKRLRHWHSVISGILEEEKKEMDRLQKRK